jgi:hypothetical protein
VGRDELGSAQRQTVDRLDLDRVLDPAGREIAADPAGRQRRGVATADQDCEGRQKGAAAYPACKATPWAWLPADIAITPARSDKAGASIVGVRGTAASTAAAARRTSAIVTGSSGIIRIQRVLG